MVRNAKDDLALCDKATPGPWIVMPEKCGPDGQTVYQEESLGPICDVGDPYPRGGNHPTENMHFIAMAREALPYWIKRAQKMEKALGRACVLITNHVNAYGTGMDLPMDLLANSRKPEAWKKYFMEEDSR